MNPCETYAELLPEFLDGALPPDLAANTATHLAECAHCRDELRFVRTLTRAARELPSPTPGDAVAIRIMQSVLGARPVPRRTEFGPVLDVEELADFLRVDPATLDRYIPDIPCFELGGKLLFRRETIEEWIRQRELGIGLQPLPEPQPIPEEHEQTVSGGVQWTL
jgi:hypothetical protein